MNEWQYIEDEGERRQCDHVWRFSFIDVEHKPVTSQRRCERDGKFTNGESWRCGYHTPGVGRKGKRRVPKTATA